VIGADAGSATTDVVAILLSGVGSANAAGGTLGLAAAFIRIAAGSLAGGGAAPVGGKGAFGAADDAGGSMTAGHTDPDDSGAGAGGAARAGGGDGTVASIIGPGMAMVGGEMKARTNQVTPATHATTGMTTANIETHRRAGVRSRIRLPSKSMSASPVSWAGKHDYSRFQDRRQPSRGSFWASFGVYWDRLTAFRSRPR
jgi:hypothetical protein